VRRPDDVRLDEENVVEEVDGGRQVGEDAAHPGREPRRRTIFGDITPSHMDSDGDASAPNTCLAIEHLAQPRRDRRLGLGIASPEPGALPEAEDARRARMRESATMSRISAKAGS
jgi:hypothetical protein